MAKSILVYTSSCYAYDTTEKKAVERLKNEMNHRGVKNKGYFMLDVSDVEDGTEITHFLQEVSIGDEKRLSELKKF